MDKNSQEYRYAAPIAEALVTNPEFRHWLLTRTRFSKFSDARVLHEEMFARRSPSASDWWRSHFTETCRCQGCSGHQTDIFAVFESSGVRFGLHFEVKNPADYFHRDEQAQDYRLRAACWTKHAPKRVLPHDKASTVLIFSESARDKFSAHLTHFDTLITFEQIECEFLAVAKWRQSN